MTDIKAIILDWGGVLIDDPTPAMMAYFANSLSVTAENYIKAHRKFIADLENGDMTENAFWKNVCAELGISKLPALSLWMEGFKHVYSPKQDMFSLARALHRSGYKTAVLSNTEAPSVEYFRQQDYDMFDTVIFSCGAT